MHPPTKKYNFITIKRNGGRDVVEREMLRPHFEQQWPGYHCIPSKLKVSGGTGGHTLNQLYSIPI